MATKVYILTDGLRDDRSIRAVFSTREAAEAALPLGDEAAAVEEYLLDAPLPERPPGHTLWHISAYKVLQVYRASAFERDDIGLVMFDGEGYMVDLWARDAEEARRSGTAMIDQFKATSGSPV